MTDAAARDAAILKVARVYGAMYPQWSAGQCVAVAVSEYDASGAVDAEALERRLNQPEDEVAQPPAAPANSTRMPRSERNRRAREDAKWRHALERLQERHSSDATLEEVKALGAAAQRVYSSWKAKTRTGEGAVLRYEGIESVVVRLQWRGPDRWIMVVYTPLEDRLRTVLPNAPRPAWDRRPA